MSEIKLDFKQRQCVESVMEWMVVLRTVDVGTVRLCKWALVQGRKLWNTDGADLLVAPAESAEARPGE